MKKTLLLVLLVMTFSGALAQIPGLRLQNQTKIDKLQVVPDQQRGEILKGRIDQLQANIVSGLPRTLGGFLSTQVYIDIAGEKSGYYSSNQAASMLESFFAQRKLQSCSFSSFNFRAPAPYATGRLNYLYKGAKESAQIYVMWKQVDSAWVITQFNIF